MVPAALRLVVGLGAAFLLTSLGGAGAFASPVTVPLLGWAVRTTKTRAARLALTIVAALTLYEASWILIYSLIGESALFWILSACLSVATTFVFVRLTWPRAARRSSA